ncbi:MAG TPA: hypothetical protein VMT66_13155 [Steroidobacteraceae bacterium]|nr:hypothetical protein [Steroidobacteraceae bacterium]
MKSSLRFATKALLSGFLTVVPIYLAVLLLLKAMQSVAKLVHPVTLLIPDWFPAEGILSLLLVLVICFLVGVAILTRTGRVMRQRIETSFLERIPGYGVIRSLTQQLAGESRDNAWKPALAEIEDALVPAFIIEEFEDGRYTVFVPSIPTPLAGAIYILEAKRVHLVDVPFTQALQVVSKWGSGAKALDAAMHKSASLSAAYSGAAAHGGATTHAAM